MTSATTTSIRGGESRYVNQDNVDMILVSNVRKDGESIEFVQDGNGGGAEFLNKGVFGKHFATILFSCVLLLSFHV